MVFLGIKSLASLLALLVLRSDAFAPVTNSFVRKTAPTSPRLVTFMAEGDEQTSVPSAVKSPSVVNSLTEEGECVPEDEFCVLDEKSGKMIRLTLEEKERIFLDSLQAYYATGRAVLKDEEFDLLKEDLQWNGSAVAVLNRKEAKYLAAMQAYLKGEPMIPDDEFDSLKKELKAEGSRFAVSTEPKCYIETGVCRVTFQEDVFRSNLLYVPALAIFTSLWLGLGYEIFSALLFRINPLIFLVLGGPLIYYGSKFLTENFFFENKKVAFGPCPSCEFENRVYFGDILKTEGFSDLATVKCPNCKTQYSVQRNTLRASTIPKA